ncbi:curved DNA-binding protein [Pelomonas saccharophila]|uniref:Curved DNA-binding protein n=1 Tax=Roseateles saccharophilus TaxID=304 RepID=A0ABU1YN01_ROSSA|nr:DnaJ C-terminal domain-containing protein [Roseateles saccharophilus]MDR7270232.1 curved DNA-binding protein [Roseateles saccharophilus]
MDYKDYYATLGLDPGASADEVKKAYRKLARKYHPDVSKEAGAEARFKEVAEAYEVLKDPEKRAAYDALRQDLARRRAAGQGASPPPDWDAGFEFRGAAPGDGAWDDHSDFFHALFGAARRGARPAGQRRGEDHHARVAVELEDLYRGATRSLSLRAPVLDGHGRVTLAERRIELQIPKGTLPGQHLRLQGQGMPGIGGGPPGDLYLEVDVAPHARYRVSGRDVFFDLPLAPWEAALGAEVRVNTPTGPVALKVPRGSAQGRQLRLGGRGLPGPPAGDLFAVLGIVLPPVMSVVDEEAWRNLAQAFSGFDPRNIA